MGLGVVFVNQLVKWEAQVEQDLDKMLEKAKAANERRYIGSFFFSLIFLSYDFILFCFWVIDLFDYYDFCVVLLS